MQALPLFLILLNLAAIIALYTSIAKNVWVAGAVILVVILCIIAQIKLVFFTNDGSWKEQSLIRIILVLLLAYNIYFVIRAIFWVFAEPDVPTIVLQ